MVGHIGRKKPQTMSFKGRTRADAKRRALNYWFLNKNKLGMGIQDFSARCRLQEDGRTIVFYPEGS